MRSYDLTPLFRTSVGFDRVSRLMDTALDAEQAAKGYPPYNIVKRAENEYDITLAVAGFSEDELEVQTQDGILTIRGRHKAEPEGVEYLHRGIAARAFERRLSLADHIKVVGARLENGLLHLALQREIPERLKPRTIAIERTDASDLVAAK